MRERPGPPGGLVIFDERPGPTAIPRAPQPLAVTYFGARACRGEHKAMNKRSCAAERP